MNAVRLSASLLLLAVTAAAYAGASTPLHQMNDTELSGVTGQTQAPVVRIPPKYAPSTPPPLFQRLFPNLSAAMMRSGDTAITAFPLFGLLTADISARNVNYGSNTPAIRLNADGSYNLPLPVSIGELDLQNIRINPNDTNSFGSIQLRGVDLSHTVIVVLPPK